MLPGFMQNRFSSGVDSMAKRVLGLMKCAPAGEAVQGDLLPRNVSQRGAAGAVW
jgi:hypothetical protein